MTPKHRYWLMKSEPTTYSIDDLARDKITCWEGVRNYQARNLMRDEMQVGDLALFYHSSAEPPGVAGIARICKAAYPDHHAFDPKSKYFDPKASPDKPTWMMVDVEFVEKFPTLISLAQLREIPALQDMLVLRRGMRLSVQPVDPKHFAQIEKMGYKA